MPLRWIAADAAVHQGLAVEDAPVERTLIDPDDRLVEQLPGQTVRRHVAQRLAVLRQQLHSGRRHVGGLGQLARHGLEDRRQTAVGADGADHGVQAVQAGVQIDQPGRGRGELVDATAQLAHDPRHQRRGQEECRREDEQEQRRERRAVEQVQRLAAEGDSLAGKPAGEIEPMQRPETARRERREQVRGAGRELDRAERSRGRAGTGRAGSKAPPVRWTRKSIAA